MGIHFSNELLDAMPVRLINHGTEKFVGLDNEKFVFVDRQVDQTIFNQPALDCIDEISANLQLGYVMTVDYGSLDDDCERSVRVRAQHQNLDSPFQSIGEADITMSVDWRSIIERAQANGLHVAGFTDQHHFLTGIISQFDGGGAPEASAGDSGQSPLPVSRKGSRELQTLLHPEMLGRAFQVLALAKNIGAETNPLAGFRFATESRASLRLTDSVG